MEITEDWVLVEGEYESHPFFMSVNDALSSFAEKAFFHIVL